MLKLIYDKNVNLTKLTGTNKQYIDQHLPHLSELISDDLEKVVDQSEMIIIGHKQPELEDVCDKYPDKIFLDLVRIQNSLSNGRYEGICW